MSSATPPQGTICAYCGEAVLTGREKPEHPIQAAIGASWVVFTTCDPCNAWADVEIDQPFLDDNFILMLRSEHDVRDVRHSGRGRRIPSPLMRGYTEEGMLVVADEDGTPHLRSERVVEEPDGEFSVITGSEVAQRRILRDLAIKAALDGKTMEAGESILVEEQPRITGRLEIRPWRWRRTIAKVALAAGSVAYPEEWRLSPDAVLLRTWMRDQDALPYDYCPFEPVAGTRIEELVQPPHHAVFFRRHDAVTVLTIVLFGDIAFKLPVDTTGRTLPQIAWYLDPRRPRANGQITWTQLLTNVARHRFPEEFGGRGQAA